MRQLILLIVTFAAIAATPFWLASDFWLNAVLLTVYAALLGQAWNILAGFGGQFSFGHALFFGTGAYTVAVLQVQFGFNPWVGFFIGGAMAGLVALAMGFLTFRYGLRGSYFALVTLAFAEVFRILSNSVSFTGAGEGILIPLDQRASQMQFPDLSGYFWFICALTFACFLTVWWLRNSRFGARLVAVRDNEEAAAAIGVDAFTVKLKAIVLSAVFSGLAGVFYAQKFLYLEPGIAFGPSVSVESLLVAIIGGIGTLFGPLLGAAVLHAVAEFARHVIGDQPGLSMIIYGGILVLMVMFAPRGLAGIGQSVRSFLTGSKNA